MTNELYLFILSIGLSLLQMFVTSLRLSTECGKEVLYKLHIFYKFNLIVLLKDSLNHN